MSSDKVRARVRLILMFCVIVTLWVGALISLPYILWLNGLVSYFICLYVIVGFVIFVWFRTDIPSFTSVQEDFHKSKPIVFAVFWYFYLIALIFIIMRSIFREEGRTEKNSLGDLKKPDEEIQLQVKNLIGSALNQSSTNETLFNAIDNLNDQEIETFYINKLRDEIKASLSLSMKIDEIHAAGFDVTNLKFNDHSLSDFHQFYDTHDYDISQNPDNADPYVEIDDKLEIAFKGSIPLLLRVNFKAELEARRQINKIPSDWKVLVTPSFRKAFNKLSSAIQNRAFEAVEKILLNPMQPISNTCTPLSGNKKGLWRYRVGDFRILYEPNKSDSLIVFLNISERGNAYKF